MSTCNGGRRWFVGAIVYNQRSEDTLSVSLRMDVISL